MPLIFLSPMNFQLKQMNILVAARQIMKQFYCGISTADINTNPTLEQFVLERSEMK